MKVLSNCQLTKLREYAQSYGGAETLIVPYIKEFNNEIWLLNECGEHYRTMKKGTKLLVSFTGKEITERQLTGRAKKAIALRTNKRLIEIEASKIREEERKIIAEKQLKMWTDFLNNNPQSKAKYIEKCNTMSSGKWRNYLRLKAARHINNQSFQQLEISVPQLREALNF